MYGVILDRISFDSGDLDLEQLQACLEHWHVYDITLADQTLERIGEAEVVVVNKVIIDRPVIEQCSRLKLVLVAATGANNVDLEACRQHGVTVCNARNYSTPAVVQHTIALILALTTRLIDYDRDVKQGKWQSSPIFCLLNHPITELAGKKLGIIGYGNLGRGVARVAESLGMEIFIAQRPGTQTATVAGRIKLEQLLSEVDVLSLHCPLTAATHHLVGRAELGLMKNNALLINTARGPIVDQAALVAALRAGEIAGAGIDVLDQEPPPNDNPLLDPTVPNLIVTPHTAWASVEARRRLVLELSTNLKAWLAGSPRNVL